MSKRFKVTAILAQKWCYRHRTRSEWQVEVMLDTVHGVDLWLGENQPLISFKVEDVIQGRDVTDMFTHIAGAV
jgi:hypothetical protein